MSFVPHTGDDTLRILRRLGLDSEEELFASIPETLRSEGPDLPPPLDEGGVTGFLSGLAEKNRPRLCFAGGGAWKHHVPAAVDYLASRSEFLTAYTPYQPEMMQGSLQAIYEYQTMIASLCGLDAANASMYDGATALYESVLMSVRLTRRWKAVVDTSVNPLYRKALGTYAGNLGIELIEVPFEEETGTPDLDGLASACGEETACVVTSYPNYFGRMVDLAPLCSAVSARGAMSVVVLNPLASALAESPGKMGADIVCGEAQPFGLHLSWGGPYLGFLAAKQEYVRRMPGRIVGATEDARSRRGFVLTLQTREQHIRREKAVSNICSNQALCALRACIYLTLAGKKGLGEVAAASMHNARLLRERMLSIEGVNPVFAGAGAWFNEFAVRLPADAAAVVRRLALEGILAGIPLARYYPSLGEGALLLSATETTGSSDVDEFASVMEKAVRS